MQMDAKFFVGHVQYSRWATLANLDAAAKLTEDELHRPMGDSFKGVLGTLVHTFRADRVWLNRLKGDVKAPMIPKGESFTFAELREAWTKVLEELESVIGGFSEEDLAADIRFFSVVKQKELQVPRWQAILHMVNHASYHRGQITTMLLQLNHQPASTDLIFYYLRDQLSM
jgi:uncharacterized damage-inducible protein DinB